MATFQGAAFVEEQLRSILAQGRAVDEIIVSDDRSSDATRAIVRRVLDDARSGTDIRLLTDNPMPGVRGNFQHAIHAASGDVVFLSDQDDLWLPDRVERTLEQFALAPDAVVVHADAYLVDGGDRLLGATLFGALGIRPAEIELINGGDAFSVLIRRNVATGATMAVRREWALGAMPFPAMWVHDEWLATLAAAENGLRAMDRPVIRYRQHAANQIGVQVLTIRAMAQRIAEPRGDRFDSLAARSRTLRDQLEARDTSAATRALVARKAAFEAARSQYPRARPLRVPAIIRQRRLYPEFASRGALDIVRDLLQPA